MKTWAPSSAKRWAVASPMPLLPPVMTATFPSSFFGMPRPPLLCDEVSNPGEERRPTASLLRRGKGQERIREFLPGGATQGGRGAPPEVPPCTRAHGAHVDP